VLTGDNRFVFVAPMYNASAYLSQMLVSVVGQSYTNWKVILIDDVSDQHEVTKEKEIVESWRYLINDVRGADAKISVTWNADKKWEVANVLHGISMCKDNDIVCRIDADDWLTELDALAILASAYEQLGCDCLWTSHRWSFSDKNISGPMPPSADPYRHPWVSSHLKTFRKHLLNSVNDQNFRGEDGNYIRRAGDQAIFLPVLHQAKKRSYLPRCMYHYTIKDIPETYQTDDAKFQRDEALFLRERGYVS
jgi:glycosyltransferase involved in cell wall biosynthesis